MSARDSGVIKEFAKGQLYKGYGMRWEGEALDLYERRTGGEVHSRNERR